MHNLQAYNKKLLSNILPVHVAEYFMSGDKNNDVSLGADMRFFNTAGGANLVVHKNPRPLKRLGALHRILGGSRVGLGLFPQALYTFGTKSSWSL